MLSSRFRLVSILTVMCHSDVTAAAADLLMSSRLTSRELAITTTDYLHDRTLAVLQLQSTFDSSSLLGP